MRNHFKINLNDKKMLDRLNQHAHSREDNGWGRITDYFRTDEGRTYGLYNCKSCKESFMVESSRIYYDEPFICRSCMKALREAIKTYDEENGEDLNT